MKLQPIISGCSVRTNTPTRHSGNPACTSRSEHSAIIWLGVAAERAPSMIQSETFRRLVASTRKY
jgi:hypothetical protein